jgi:NDP-sugar pyrophosphorylase family protein
LFALVIAGGEGERLRPLTDDRPKNMVPVAGRPIVEHQLEWLSGNGVTDVVFLCGYKAEVLEAHVGDGSRFGVRTQYSREDEPLGRGGALRLGAGLIPSEENEIFACNGDIITDQPLEALLAYHRENGAVATVMLAPLHSPYGVVDVEEAGRVRAFREKPVLPYWINAGIYVLSRRFLEMLPVKGDHETTVFPQLAAEGSLFGFRSEAYWRPVDSIKDISEATKELVG